MVKNAQLLNKMIGLTEEEVCLFGRGGEIIYCSVPFAKLLGVGEGETVPNLKDSIVPSWLCRALGVEKSETVKDSLEAIWSGKKRRAILEFAVGESSFLRFSFNGANRVANTDSAPSVVALTVQDITAEIDRKGDFLMSTLVSHAPQPVALISQKGQIMRVNPAFSDLCGMSSEKLDGMNVTNLMSLEMEELLSVHSGDSKGFYDKVMLLPKKHRFPVEVVVGSYKLELAETPLYYVMVTDLRSWQEREALKRRMSIMARQRSISADLHDNVAQLLALLKMRFEKLMPMLGDGVPTGAVKEFVDCRRMVDDVQVEMRQMIRYLREESSVREEDCLWGVEDVLRYATNVLELKIVDMGIASLNLLEDSAQRQVTQLIREVLANAHKHAETKTVWLTVVQDEDSLLINVVDKGKGFDPETVDKNEHYGLSILSERVNEIGGEVFISSEIGKGTDITFKVPFHK